MILVNCEHNLMTVCNEMFKFITAIFIKNDFENFKNACAF